MGTWTIVGFDFLVGVYFNFGTVSSLAFSGRLIPRPDLDAAGAAVGVLNLQHLVA